MSVSRSRHASRSQSPSIFNHLLAAALAVTACLAPGGVAWADTHDHDGDDEHGCHGHKPLEVETIATFDASKLETPESLAIDSLGNTYVNLGLTGEIRKIDEFGAQSTFAVLPIGAPPLTMCGPYFGIMGALAIDPYDNLYVSLASCIPADRGIWRLTPSGEAKLIARLPAAAVPDGIAYRHGRLYVADEDQGLIWRAPADGSGPAMVWADAPLLKPSVGHAFPGPNGVQFFDDELYVSNSDQGTILAIPLEAGGAAGPVRIHASNIPCDDFAFDVLGNMYCTTDPFGTLVRISPDGSLEVLLTAADGLDGPSSSLFGRRGEDRLDLYITNGAFPFFSTTHHPSLLRVDLGILGAPRF